MQDNQPFIDQIPLGNCDQAKNASRRLNLNDPAADDINRHLVQNPLYTELLDRLITLAKPQKDGAKNSATTCFLSFFLRNEGQTEFREGDIVALNKRLNLIMPDATQLPRSGFVVVNDTLAKKLGYPLQSKGHWCSAVGLVQVHVEGIVVKGDVIGFCNDGKCSGMVLTKLSSSQMIGFSVDSKSETKSNEAKRTVSILISQDYNSGINYSRDVSLLGSPAPAVEESTWYILSMLERLVHYLSRGSEDTQLLGLLERLRQAMCPEGLSQAHANNLRRILHQEPDEVPRESFTRMGLRFSLPSPARIGNHHFQNRNIVSNGKSVDALEFFEDAIGKTPPRGKGFALRGCAGSGKTTLLSAIIFRMQHLTGSAPIIWLDASSTSAICKCMISLAKLLIHHGLSKNLDCNKQQQIGALQIINAWLQKETSWILVLDDVRDCGELQPLNIPYQNGTVLLTTRLQAAELNSFFNSMTSIDLGHFQQEEAMSFVRRSTGVMEPDAISLSKKFSFSPVPIALATAHICQKRLAVSQLMIELDSSLSQDRKNAPNKDAPFLREVLELQVGELRMVYPDCCNLLFVLSFMHPKAIPLKLIDQIPFPQIQLMVSHLLQNSLLVDGPAGTVNMHELLQQSFRDQLKDLSQRTEGTISCIPCPSCLSLCRNHNGKALSHSECLRVACKAVMAQMQSPDKGALQLAAPHALMLVEHDSRDLQLMAITAQYLSEVQKDFKKSLQLRQAVFKCQVDILKSPNHESVASTLSGIARIYETLGQHQEAIGSYEDVVRILKRCKTDFLQIAKTLDSIGMIFYKTERFKGALLRFEESLSIKESIQDQDIKSEIVITLEKIADSYHAQGYFEIALEKWRQVLDLIKAIHGECHKEVARVMNTIGMIYADLQQYEEALTHYCNALKALEEPRGGLDLYGATIYISMAKCYQCLGKYDVVLSNYKNALAVQRKLCVGREQIAISQTLDEIAYVHCVMGAYQDSVANLEESLRVKRKVFDEDSLQVARCEYELAIQQKNIGNKGQAIDLALKAHSTFARRLGTTDSKTIQAANLHADLMGLNPTINSSSPNRTYNQYVLDVSKMIGNLNSLHASGSIGATADTAGATPVDSGGSSRQPAGQNLTLLDSVPRTPRNRTPRGPGTKTPRSKKQTQQEALSLQTPQMSGSATPRAQTEPRNQEVLPGSETSNEAAAAESRNLCTDEGKEAVRPPFGRPPSGSGRGIPRSAERLQPSNKGDQDDNLIDQINISLREAPQMGTMGAMPSPRSPYPTRLSADSALSNSHSRMNESATSNHVLSPATLARHDAPSPRAKNTAGPVGRSMDADNSGMLTSGSPESLSPRAWSKSPRVLQKVQWPPSPTAEQSGDSSTKAETTGASALPLPRKTVSAPGVSPVTPPVAQQNLRPESSSNVDVGGVRDAFVRDHNWC